jgi:hypothetical protein
MEAWKKEEAGRRDRLDASVRAWLTADRWPADLDATDGYLLLLRLRAAMHWLDLGRCGIVVETTPTKLLEALLIEGWTEYFLEQHCSRLRWYEASYFCGRESAGTFTE